MKRNITNNLYTMEIIYHHMQCNLCHFISSFQGVFKRLFVCCRRMLWHHFSMVELTRGYTEGYSSSYWFRDSSSQCLVPVSKVWSHLECCYTVFHVYPRTEQGIEWSLVCCWEWFRRGKSPLIKCVSSNLQCRSLNFVCKDNIWNQISGLYSGKLPWTKLSSRQKFMVFVLN